MTKMTGTPRHDSEGFTLLEGLAVIVVCAILLSLILSVVRGAAERGKQVLCLNNLKQITSALRQYALDHDGWCPSGRTGTTGWANELAVSGYLPNGQTADLGPPLGVFVCPSQPNKNLPWGLPGDGVGRFVTNMFNINGGNYWFSTHYGVNSFFLETYNIPQLGLIYEKFKLSTVQSPTKVYFIGDCADVNGGFLPYLGVGYPNLILRHGKNSACNMVFVDGHAEVLTAKTPHDRTRWTDRD